MKNEVSIIIPCHNDAEFLKGLLSSIRRYLDKVDFHYEVVIVNNSSQDETSDVISSFKFKEVFVKKKLNPSKARNIGYKNSIGDILVFLDSDVIVTKEWAETLSNRLSSWSKDRKQFLTGDYYHISQEPSWIENSWFSHIYEKRHNYICGGNIVVDRETFDKVAGFNEDYETGEDVEFCDRCRFFCVIPEINKGFYVYHEGYPKNIYSFIKRERWHGKSDFSSLSHILESKVAIATIVFFVSHVALLFSIFISLSATILMFFIIVSLSILNYLKKKPIMNFTNLLFGVVISYFYFVGRSWAALDKIMSRC